MRRLLHAVGYLSIDHPVLLVLLGSVSVGCQSMDQDRGTVDAESWGTAFVHVVGMDARLSAVVIDIHLRDTEHYPELWAAAHHLVRNPGVLTVDGRLNLNLPWADGQQEGAQRGKIYVFEDGYDPALSRESDTRWTILIPIQSEVVKAALSTGAPVVIFPNVSLQSRGALKGLAFRWHPLSGNTTDTDAKE